MSEQGTTAGDEDRSGDAPPRKRLSLLVLLPALVFVLLALAFYYALQTGDPSKLPSALIGEPVPEFTMPAVDGLKRGSAPVPGFSTVDLARGEVSIVNVWASWCVPCHQEHPHLTALVERSGAPLYGINYKDKASAARRFLGRYGNPFKAVGVDNSGRTAIDWGVYGVPETFIIDAEGRIAHKHVGPLSPDDVEGKLVPLIEKLRTDAGG